MMFTLNGEILLDDSGSELAFKDFDTGDGKCCVQAGGLVRLHRSLVSGDAAGGRVHATQLFPSDSPEIVNRSAIYITELGFQ